MNFIKSQLLILASNTLFGFSFGQYNGIVFSLLVDTSLKLCGKATSYLFNLISLKAAQYAFVAIKYGVKVVIALVRITTTTVVSLLSKTKGISIFYFHDFSIFFLHKLTKSKKKFLSYQLEPWYRNNKYSDIRSKRYIALSTGLSEKQIENWFRNKRFVNGKQSSNVKASKEQSQLLKNYFLKNKTPTKNEIKLLSVETNLSETWLNRYFRNQRYYLKS
jgi:hypothetical protein